MDEVKEGVSPCLLVIQKRLRAQKKKLARITELEGLQSQGKELTPEQLPVVRSKPVVLAVLEELQKVEEALKEAVKEEQALAYARGATQAQEEAAESAAESAKEQEEQLARALQEQEETLNAAHSESLSRALEEAKAEHEAALKAKEEDLTASARAETAAAVETAVAEALDKALKEEMTAQHPLKDLITEPVRKLISLLYYAHLFDMQRNPWTARTETYIFQQYEAQEVYPEGRAALTGQDLFDLSYFAFSLVDRMNKRVSHQQAIQASVDMAVNWILDPAAVAIPAPPAPASITMADLQKRVSQIIASSFSTAVPPPETLPPTGLIPPTVPIPAPGFASPVIQPVRPAAVVPPSPVPTAGAAKADPYPPVAPAGQAAGYVGRPVAPPARAAATTQPAQPTGGILPGFLEEAVDNDATTIVTAQGTPPTAPPTTAPPGKAPVARPNATGTGPTSNGQAVVHHQGVYVLSDTGIPVSLAPQRQ